MSLMIILLFHGIIINWSFIKQQEKQLLKDPTHDIHKSGKFMVAFSKVCINSSHYDIFITALYEELIFRDILVRYSLTLDFPLQNSMIYFFIPLLFGYAHVVDFSRSSLAKLLITASVGCLYNLIYISFGLVFITLFHFLWNIGCILLMNQCFKFIRTCSISIQFKSNLDKKEIDKLFSLNNNENDNINNITDEDLVKLENMKDIYIQIICTREEDQ